MRPAKSMLLNSFCTQGVILYGEPGTGKTLLAKAVANSTSATFLRVVGSELIQKYLGDGPKLVRELFRAADELSPSIVFIGDYSVPLATKNFQLEKACCRSGSLADSITLLVNATEPPIISVRIIQMFERRGLKRSKRIVFCTDEIDAIGTKRYESQSGGEREIQRTMLELLNQMDGFDSMGDVKVGQFLPRPRWLFPQHSIADSLEALTK